MCTCLTRTVVGLGERSRADYIQKRDNVPRAVALERVARNLAEQRVMAALSEASAAEVAEILQILPASVRRFAEESST